MNQITDIFFKKYQKESFDFIVGIDNAGRILAPNLSLKFKTNFTYILNPYDDKFAIDFERSCPIKKGNSILLVTDVIASGNTLKESIKKINTVLKAKVKIACNIFCGNKKLISDIQREFEIKIFSINEEFPFQIYTNAALEKHEILRKEFDMLKQIKKKKI